MKSMKRYIDIRVFTSQDVLKERNHLVNQVRLSLPVCGSPTISTATCLIPAVTSNHYRAVLVYSGSINVLYIFSILGLCLQ
jgi:hypothetical protein